MYLTILDYTNGRVIIDEIPDVIDAETYIEEKYPDIEMLYMSTPELKLSINQSE